MSSDHQPQQADHDRKPEATTADVAAVQPMGETAAPQLDARRLAAPGALGNPTARALRQSDLLLAQSALGNRRVARMLAQRQDAEPPAEAPPAAPGAEAGAETSTALIVEDGAEAGPGQMTKSVFMAQARQAVEDAVAEVLAGSPAAAMAGPEIEQRLGPYAGLSASALEAAIKRDVPAAAGAETADALIPLIADRIRAEARTRLPQGGPLETITTGIASFAEAAAGAVQSVVAGLGRLFFKTQPGGGRQGADPRAVQSQLGTGQALDSTVGSGLGAAFGQDFSDVRVHADSRAASLAGELDARAFTVGQDVAFGAGEYQPGTPVGDALIAHELAHVVQQRGGTAGEGPQTKGPGDDALEEEADVAAVGAVASLWGGVKTGLASVPSAAVPRLRSGLRLQRCISARQIPPGSARTADFSRWPAGPIKDAASRLAVSTEEIDRNTAQRLVAGDITAYYFEDLEQPSDIDNLVRGYGKDPAVFTLYYQPGTRDLMLVQRNFQGFRPYGSSQIFGFRSLSVDRWLMLLVHETSHARNLDPSTPIEKYKDEFRAYWVAEYRGVANLDERARQIKEHVLRNYPEIKAAYDHDNAVKTAIDGHMRPDGNVTNR